MSVSAKVNELIGGYAHEWTLERGLLKCTYLDLGVSVSTGKILSGDFEISSGVEEQTVLLATVKQWVVNQLEGV